ncbi:MAG TPA: hypothetical protein VHA10_18135 [Hypericibacter adhaerens]|uniref:Lipoprotein SmpA/OmlA domain-containing protein n=1 Tax=Hypericibacter adhaerens TaxID=2602016 RepID=A0A5J6N7G8_9PROT|nr:hypothetical protein [Hypericibacter adhaerens]QEX25015.1 hypothetical protein FRZ61_49590 [Hypericibacter adhaerens]HWA45145.1 hypothetical protein [Hypericibacter adhaerens]
MVATGLMALALAACAARTLPPSASATPAATPAPAAADASSPAPAVQQATATTPAATESSDAKDLVGLGPDELQHLFGHPQLVRNETGAEVWQYRAQACVLDLYLYPQESEGTPLRVTYLEARDRSAASLATAPCVSALMTEKRISSL